MLDNGDALVLLKVVWMPILFDLARVARHRGLDSLRILVPARSCVRIIRAKRITCASYVHQT